MTLRTIALTSSLLVGGLGASLFIAIDPLAAWDRLQSERFAVAAEFRPELDPMPGAAILPPPAQPGPTAERVLIAALGGCGSCSTKSFDPAGIRTDGYREVILLYEAQDKSIPASVRRFPKPFRVVADPKGELHRRLNASWSPRFAVLDGSYRLVRIQSQSSEALQFCKKEAFR